MYIYRLLSILIIGLYLLSPELIKDWGDAEATWYRPFAFWFGLILLAAWLEHKRSNNEL